MLNAVTPVNFVIAFAAGLVSFASPCMLPLVPGYLAFLLGPEASESGAPRDIYRRQLRQAVIFVGSFTLLFTLMGLGVGLLGGRILHARRGIEIGAGILIAVMGLSMAIEPVLPLVVRQRFGSKLPTSSRGRPLEAVVLGLAFAAAWSPCLGPALAAILALAASQQHAATSSLLLLTYALGLGVPFIVVALASGRLTPLLRRAGRHRRTLQLVSGLVLVGFGIAVALGLLGQLSARLSGIGGFGI
jgi:cytochrome c-type biogenesis protein